MNSSQPLLSICFAYNTTALRLLIATADAVTMLLYIIFSTYKKTEQLGTI